MIWTNSTETIEVEIDNTNYVERRILNWNTLIDTPRAIMVDDVRV